MPPPRTLARLMGIDPVRRQSLISLSSTLILTAVGFVATMYFAHALGEVAYGIFSLFLAYYGIFNLVGDGGFGGAAVKRISEGKDQDAYFTAFLLLRVALLAVSVVVVLALSDLLTADGTSSMVPWLIIALIFGVLAGVLGNGLYGEGMIGASQTANLLNNVVKVLIQVIAVLLGYGIAGLVGGFVFGMFVGSLFCLRYIHLRLARFTTAHLKNLLAFSFWIFLTSSGAMVFSHADTILIGYFMSPADVGVYRIAFQFTTAATFTTMALHTTLYPKISRWHTRGALDLVKLSLSRAFTYSLLLAVPVAVGGWILGDRLLYFFYGAGFAA
ncbi:oligosaccharide flippase family protein, partial [uncultured Methanofollis sp.]|uniref:oligosaccharide flippase family protein n=1 Tax=uncultured Methanofollis sp. TaxID=262500 RepID=UPI00263726AF